MPVYQAYINRQDGPVAPWYDSNLPGLVAARKPLAVNLPLKQPETFRGLYDRFKHNVNSWSSLQEIPLPSRFRNFALPVGVPEGALFLPAPAWQQATVENAAFTAKVWAAWALGGVELWGVAGPGLLPGYAKVKDALLAAAPSFVGPPAFLWGPDDESSDDGEASDGEDGPVVVVGGGDAARVVGGV